MARKQPGEPYYRVSVKEAKEILDKDKNAVVVDVRRPDEWRAGHVTGALHIPVDEVPGRVEELPKDKKRLFICAAGARSALAAEYAAAMGLDGELLYNIEEGTPTWIAHKYPTSFGDKP